MKCKGPVFVSVKIKPEIENLPIARRTRSRCHSRQETIETLQEELGIPVV